MTLTAPTNTARKSASGPTSDRERPTGTKCGLDCFRPTPSQAHCTVCHRTFGGVTGFDAHRRDGWCIDPTTLGMVQSDVGIWRTPMSDQARAALGRADDRDDRQEQ